LSKKVVFVARPMTIDMQSEETDENEATIFGTVPAEEDFGDQAWYKNGWVWLIIAIPSLTIIGCMFTIYLALSHPVHLVYETPGEGEAPAAQSR